MLRAVNKEPVSGTEPQFDAAASYVDPKAADVFVLAFTLKITNVVNANGVTPKINGSPVSILGIERFARDEYRVRVRVATTVVAGNTLTVDITDANTIQASGVNAKAVTGGSLTNRIT